MTAATPPRLLPRLPAMGLPLLALCAAMALALAARAQCPVENTAFSAGERLDYKLYFNWKFVWIGAGDATFTIEQETREGRPAYRATLLTNTSKRIDRFFTMRDTLTSIVTPSLVPLYYRKGAYEGGKHRLNEATYSYEGGQSLVDLLYVNPAGEETREAIACAECAYDMVSMMLRARSLDGSQYSKGDKILFPMADGRRVEEQTLVCRGKKTFKTEETKVTYRCLVFSFVEYHGKKEKEVITFYVTDDANHIPVRLDMYLRFGVAKAYLRTATGVRNEQTSIVKQKQ